MPRVPIVAGNWKMNPSSRGAALDLIAALRDSAGGIAGVTTIVCPPYIYLPQVRDALRGSAIQAGAQNAYWEEKGAYTGEISIVQLAELVDYVIVGHSERRQLFGETDETVCRRLRAVLSHGMKPIMCVGETVQERQAGETADVLTRQLRLGLEGLTLGTEFIVAYEPVWAIGTGLAADAATAQETIALIRRALGEIAGETAADMRILYGGSVTPDNVGAYAKEPDIDGPLVGGASLTAAGFTAIIQAVADASAGGA